MNTPDLRRIRRVVTVLTKQGLTSRQKLRALFDARGTDWEDIRGIGRTLAPVLRQLMKLPAVEWTMLTTLPYYEPNVVSDQSRRVDGDVGEI